jgi:nicotinamidase-related amidase
MMTTIIYRWMFIFSWTFIFFLESSFAGRNNGFAVVLIDMQDGFYLSSGTAGSIELKNLVNKQVDLLRWAVRNDVPVLVFEYENFGITDPKLMKILTKHRFHVLEKNRDSGFEGKSRDQAIKKLIEWEVDALIVAGINGPYCVKETIMGALNSGFDVMTTSWIVGNLNNFPATFPNGSWYFKNHKFTVFPTLESMIE